MDVELKKVFSKLKQEIEPIIKRILLINVDSAHKDLVSYQIDCGGKRLRPILAILTYKMFGGKKKEILWPAASLEILHNYTLILDDIIDHSEKRRKQLTVWRKYGAVMAQCISMTYAAAIFDLPANINNKDKILKLLSETLKVVTDGQILDILFEQSGREGESYIIKNRHQKVDLKDYYTMISQKTTKLIETSCLVGGLCAGTNKKNLNFLKEFGFNLGMAFQIQDDILDIFGDEKKFGKQIGKDIIEHKLGNIVIALTLDNLNKRDKKDFLNILKSKVNFSQLKRAMILIKKTNARQIANKEKEKFIFRAQSLLFKMPNNKWRKILDKLSNYLLERAV